MATSTGESRVNKFLLVWPMLIPNEVRALFTMVFMDISGLINYLSAVHPNTDTFHLIIHLDCLGDLVNVPVFECRQVAYIDVICDSASDLKRAEHRFNSRCENMHFCTIRDLLSSLWKAQVDRAFVSSGAIDESALNTIISLIEDRISAKRSNDFVRHSHVLEQNTSTLLHGFPVRHINDLAPCFICPSCELVYQEPYQLECGHRQCKVCVTIQTSCATCSKAVSRDKVSLDQNLQMKMQDLSIPCSDCEWTGPLKDYQIHFKEKHRKLITCSIRNRKDDESIFHQQHITETNQEIFLGNLSSSDSEIRIKSLNGTCIWKISDIDDIKNNATSGKPKSIYSAPFYVFPNGYKMCLRLYINGDCKARNTHMSLFFVIMRGDYDDKLRWPFQCKVTFSLIDQSTTNDNQLHISLHCWPNTTAICFERPNSDMNIAYGIPMFVSLELLKQNQNRYVQNNTMYMKVEVDLLTERPTLPLIDGVGELPNDEEHVNTSDEDVFGKICFR